MWVCVSVGVHGSTRRGPGVVGQYGSRTPASMAVLVIRINSSFRHLDLIRHMNKLNSLKT